MKALNCKELVSKSKITENGVATMNIKLEEYEQLKEKNEELVSKLKRLTRLLKSSVMKKDMEYLLNILIPDVNEDSGLPYDAFFEINGRCLEFAELLRILALLVKTNRCDLAFYISQKYTSEHNIKSTVLSEETVEDFQLALNRFVKEIVGQKNIEEIHLLVLFEILSYKDNDEFLTEFEIMFDNYIDELITTCSITRNDYWLVKLLSVIWHNEHNTVLKKYFDYLYDRRLLISRMISEDNMNSWRMLADYSGYELPRNKIISVKKYESKKHSRFKVPKTLPLNSKNDETSNSNKKNTENWKNLSDLRTFGYEVTNKTDEQRRNALNNALMNIHPSRVISHISWLLENSYKKDGSVGDFSKSIKAYEKDLQYLEGIMGRYK